MLRSLGIHIVHYELSILSPRTLVIGSGGSKSSAARVRLVFGPGSSQWKSLRGM